MAPWDAEDLLPTKPPGSEYGFIAGKKAYWCSQEDLVRACGTGKARGVSVVWTPESPRLVTAWEVPFLAEAMKGRALAVLRDRVKLALAWVFIWGGLAAMHWKRAEFAMYAAIAVVAGVAPLAWLQWMRRRIERSGVHPGRTAKSARFYLWVGRRPKRTRWILLACISAAAAWQVVIGVDRSTMIAGHIPSLVTAGEPWRLLTAAFLHANLTHFVLNALALFALAGTVEALTSRSFAAVVYLVAVVTGALASQLLRPDTNSVGASGGILGFLGVMAVFAWKGRRELPRVFVHSTLAMIGSVVVLGAIAYQMIDNAAHAGGFAGGAVVGALWLARHGLSFAIPSGRLLRAAGWASMAVAAAVVLALPLTAKSAMLFEGLMEHGREVESKDPKQAIEVFDKAIEMKPSDPSGYWARGVVRHKQKDYAGAIEDATKAIALDPKPEGPYYNRGLSRQELGDLNGALADFGEAIRRKPGDADLFLTRAGLHVMRRDQAAARSDLMEALKFAKTDWPRREYAETLLESLRRD